MATTVIPYVYAHNVHGNIMVECIIKSNHNIIWDEASSGGAPYRKEGKLIKAFIKEDSSGNKELLPAPRSTRILLTEHQSATIKVEVYANNQLVATSHVIPSKTYIESNHHH